MSPNGRRQGLECVQRLLAIIVYILASHADNRSLVLITRSLFMVGQERVTNH